MRKLIFIGLLSAIVATRSAQAQSLSPDGSFLLENLTTSDGTWTFGAQYDSIGNWYINLNGQIAAGGAGSEMVVANGGRLYARGTDDNWYLWVNGGWAPATLPTLPPAPAMPRAIPSPDGSILVPALQTLMGTWTFGADYGGAPGNWYINLNGQQAANGVGSEIAVANGGQVYAIGTDGNWYLWQNGGWAGGISNPLLTKPASPATTANGASITIFGDAVPQNAVEADFSAVTLGVKFWSSQSGTIAGIRFYRGTTSPQGFVARLYTAGGTLLGSVNVAEESGPVPGWQVAYFPNPISISANQTYIAAYYSPSGQYADDYYGLTSGATNAPLTAPASATVGGNGIYNYGNAFPSSVWEDSNYYVDVMFTPTASTPYLTLTFNPPNPSISADAPLGSVVATITLTWSDGSPFTGTLSFGPPYSNDQGLFAISGNNLIVNPSGPGVFGDANTVQNVTISATQ